MTDTPSICAASFSIPLHDTSEVSAPEGGSTEHDDSYEGAGYTGAAADVERLLNRIAENSVTAELERQRTEELTELAQSISYGDIHGGVSKTVHRIASVSEELKEEYQSIAGDLLHISSTHRKLQCIPIRRVLPQIHHALYPPP